jgi:hypothetical protein
LVLAKSTLSAILVHISMAISIKAINTLIRGFLWCDTKVASGGRCLVAWVNVACPTRFGSLGLPDLRTFGMALRLRWLWLECTDPDKTWVTFRFPADHAAQAFFDASISVEVGDGSRALFWEDNWLVGCSIKLLAPSLWAAVSPRVRRSRTVQEGLCTGPHGIRWVADVTHARLCMSSSSSFVLGTWYGS